MVSTCGVFYWTLWTVGMSDLAARGAKTDVDMMLEDDVLLD